MKQMFSITNFNAMWKVKRLRNQKFILQIKICKNGEDTCRISFFYARIPILTLRNFKFLFFFTQIDRKKIQKKNETKSPIQTALTNVCQSKKLTRFIKHMVNQILAQGFLVEK